MFIRRDRQTLKDGQAVTYISLAHNVRERDASGKSRPKPIIFARLGREDDVDIETAGHIRDAFDRYLRKRLREQGADEQTVRRIAGEVPERVPALRILTSKAFGMRVVVEAVWKSLGLQKALSKVEAHSGGRYRLERVVFAMVLHRLVDPGSKRACNEWIANEAWFPEGKGLDVHHFYRALDVLDAHTDAVMAAVGAAARASCSTSELELLLMDTTSTYTESEFDDLERAQIQADWDRYLDGHGDRPSEPVPQVLNEPPLRMRGHSKDHRPRQPQVKIGLVTTRSGQVVDMQTEAGHTHDQRLSVSLLQAARARLPDHRLAAVMDSGMGGNSNLKAIDAMQPPLDRVSAVPLRRSKTAETMLLAKPGRWRKHPYKEGYKVRWVQVPAAESPSGRPELWVATRNEKEARRQLRVLDVELARVKEALAAQKPRSMGDLSTCKVLGSRKRRRLVRESKRGDRLVLNQERIRLERRRAGVHVLRSTLTDLPVASTLEAYDAQYGIERQFRTYKGPLKLRPMHHRASRRIKAHILMCTLSLMVLREVERTTGLTLEEVQRRVGRVRVTRMQQGRTQFWQREEWSDEARRVLEAVGAKAGPRTWGAERVEVTD